MTTVVKGLLVMDVDSTLIQEEVIDLLGEEAGFGSEIAAITEATMRGELDFEQALLERVALLKGLPVSIFDRVFEKIHLQAGARELIDQLHQRGYKIGVVSGGFHEVVDRLVEELGLDYAYANRLDSQDKHLTGRLLGEVVTKETKLAKLQEWAAANGLTLAETIAMGDGANDLPMIQAAGLGVAFCAKPIVREQAPYQLTQPNLYGLIELMEQEKFG